MRYAEEIEERFKRHLFLEYSKSFFTKEGMMVLHEGLQKLYEERGILPNLGAYTKILQDNVYLQINLNASFGRAYIENNIFKNIKTCFFENVNIVINYTNCGLNTGDGRYLHGEGLNEIVNGRLKDLFIDINLQCDKEHFDENLCKIFEHELTHAYENYKRLMNNALSLKNANKVSGYENNKDWYETESENTISPSQALKRCTFYLNKSEMNACITMIRQEMIKNIEIYSEINNVSTLLKKCNVYQEYKNTKIYLDFLINLKNEQAKQNVLNTFNKIFNQRVKKYSSLKQILRLTFEKRVEKAINKMCKVAFDIYHEYKQTSTVSSTTDGKLKKIIN